MAHGGRGRHPEVSTNDTGGFPMSIVVQPRRQPKQRVPSQPVIAAVDGSAAGRAATVEAIASARELGAAVLFVHVRRGPSTVWGRPFYQRRLERALREGREALATATAQARAAGVEAQTEILEGPPARRIAELARSRNAQLVIVGPRRRRPRASVFRGVAAMGLPVRRANSAAKPAHV
jgi:nucleotide-binding universal stress UspA family protein